MDFAAGLDVVPDADVVTRAVVEGHATARIAADLETAERRSDTATGTTVDGKEKCGCQ
jgi:hypothetical protein